MFFLPTPLRGVGGEQSETEGGVSAMANDGECPFMFDGTLSFDRVLMPASLASTALRPPFHHFVVPLPPRAGAGKVLGTWFTSPPRKLKESKGLS